MASYCTTNSLGGLFGGINFLQFYIADKLPLGSDDYSMYKALLYRMAESILSTKEKT